MSSSAVLKKKNELTLQLLDFLNQNNLQDGNIDNLRRAIETSPEHPDTAVLASQVLMKYKEQFSGEMAATFKRWVLLN